MTTIEYQYQITMSAQRRFRLDTILQVGTVVVNGSKFIDILPECKCIYNVSSRESESRSTRGKLAAEMALKLEKSDLNLYLGVRNCCEEKKVLFDTIIWIDLLFNITCRMVRSF